MLVGLLLALLVSLPAAYGFALSTPEMQYGGFVIGVEDGNSYLAKMMQGREGHWLYTLAYTPEPHSPGPFFGHYLLLGQLAGLLNLSLPLAINLSRLFTIPFGLVSFYAFAAMFLPDTGLRQLATALFAFSAGLGWLWLLLGLPTELGKMPVDIWVPDASFFLSAFTFAHLPLSIGLMLWVVIGLVLFVERGGWRWWLLAAGCGLLVSVIHPYKLVVVGAILLPWLLWQSYRRQLPLWRSLWRLALVMLPATPYLLWVLWVFETNFAFAAWREQSLTWSPPPQFYLLGFGLLLPLAGLGAWQANRLQAQRVDLLRIWLVLGPLLAYVPIPLQRRFLDGYQAVLAVLAALGLAWLLARWPSPRLRFATGAGLLLVLSLTNLLLWSGALLTVGGRQAPLFHPGSQQAAFAWLADNAAGELVFTSHATGNVLPGYAPLRVFVGHGPETVRSADKSALVSQFFDAATPDSWRQALLRQYGIGYLYYGPNERILGGFSPTDVSYLQLVYDSGPVKIYRVVGN
ncbi:MAG: hypothetical protein Kow0031_13550 [Anaerolineae bacterium]